MVLATWCSFLRPAYPRSGIPVSTLAPPACSTKSAIWGIEVLEVNAGSFADAAGLARGDRLIRIGGRPIYTRNDIWGLVATQTPGTSLSVEYVRDGQRCEGVGQLSAPALRAVG